MTEKPFHLGVLVFAILCDFASGLSKASASRKGRRIILRAALPAILVSVIPAVSDVNPADADVAVRLHISLIDFDAAGDFLALANAALTFVIRSLLRLNGFILGKF